MTLHIVGGTYYEYCRDPYWNELYGSGLRAAHALAKNGCEIIFHTCIGNNDKDSIVAILSSLGVGMDLRLIEKTGDFFYDYPLANPEINYPLINTELSYAIHEDNVLVYGMLEGIPLINGNKVVYDPQSPNHPKPFFENGSFANELIIVANEQEIKQLAGSDSLSAIEKFVFEEEKALAAIVKRGPNGALLLQKNLPPIEVPAYITKYVWPIGSGDVFSATFAQAWIVQGRGIVEAARVASYATAIYVESTVLPAFESNDSELIEFYNKMDVTKEVYLAGPFFNMSQRWLIEQFRSVLMKLGLKVFSPFHDVGLGVAEDVVEKDIEALNRADLVLSIADGLDSGTLFEVGYATARNKKVLVFSENVSEADLTMLVGTNCIIESDFSTIIYKTLWQLYNEK